MKIAYLTHDTPDVFYRVGQYLDFLKARGVDTRILRTPRRFLERLKVFQALASFDVVVVQRRLFGWPWLGLLKHYAHRLILDVDDAIMFSSDPEQPSSKTRSRHYASLVEACTAVIAGNTYLQEQTLELSPGARVHVIPTVLDVHSLPVKTHDETRPVVIGWIGSSSTIQYLDLIRPAIEEVLRRYPRTIFRIVSNAFPAWDFAEQKIWARADEATDVLGMDIGVMPLPDTPWTRGKCGFKIIQYMSAGLPVVVSPVGANRDIVAGSQTGYFATGHPEWVEALGRLIESCALRVELGSTGRKRAESHFSVQAQAPRYYQILQEACHGKQSR